MNSIETPIADQVVLLRKAAAERMPADVLAAFTGRQAELDAEGVPAGDATPGSPMPDGALLDAGGEPTSLTAVRAGRPAVVVFYRGAWCPYCNLTLRSYEKALSAELDTRGVALVAISPQKPDGASTAKESNELSFAVLSDPGNQIGAALGILSSQGEATRKAQGALGLDVAATNADGTDTVPMPTVVVVDSDGVIRYIDVHPNYTTRTEPGEILDALDTLARG